jgi:hypothetical protein
VDHDLGAVLLFLSFACWLTGLVGRSVTEQVVHEGKRPVGDREVMARYRRGLWTASVLFLIFGIGSLVWASVN